MNLRKIPVSLITGFLGSGKTTLLNCLLRDPLLRNVLVLINEFGEIGLDHHLVESVDGDLMVMTSGCLCCTIQTDLAKTLHGMAIRRAEGEVPAFQRVVLETTGLADPAPIIHTLMQNSLIAAQYRLDGVISTVDAVNGSVQLDRQPEALKQAAMADRMVLTKTDLATSHAEEALRQRLRALNPAAPILASARGEAEPPRLFDAGLYNPNTKSLDVRRWLNAAAYETHRDVGHAHAHGEDGHPDVNRHDSSIRALCLAVEQPIEWKSFAAWAQDLADRHGASLLRLKAILNSRDHARPLVVHGVQHLFHPVVELPAWPDDDRRSRIVLITRDLNTADIEAQLRAHLGVRQAA